MHFFPHLVPFQAHGGSLNFFGQNTPANLELFFGVQMFPKGIGNQAIGNALGFQLLLDAQRAVSLPFEADHKLMGCFFIIKIIQTDTLGNNVSNGSCPISPELQFCLDFMNTVVAAGQDAQG